MGVLICCIALIIWYTILTIIILRHEEPHTYHREERSSGKVWLTSDLHFGHSKSFLYEPRGFKSVEDMMRWIMEAWNNTISVDDDVYVLGDLMLNDDEVVHSCLRELHGNIHVITGNHDTDRRIDLYKSFPNVVEVVEAKRLRYGKYHFYLTHYPTLVGNFDDGDKLYQKTINLCGHSHTSDPFADWDKGIIYHCELDAHRNMPVSIDEIINDIQKKIKS